MLPSACLTRRSIVSVPTVSPSTWRTSRSPALRPSSFRRISWTFWRSAHSLGNTSDTSGRARASTIHGWSLRSRSAVSMNRTVREIAPVQVLEHDQDRPHGGLGLEEVHPRPAHLLAHELGILARGLERGAAHLAVGERRADELAEELHHAPLPGGGHVLRHPRADPVPALLERLGAGHPERAAQRLGEQVQRRAGAQRVAAADPDRHRLGALLDAAHELGGEPGLAHPRRGRHDHGPRLRLVDALVEDPGQRAELPVAADARGRAAEERPRPLRQRALAAQQQLRAWSARAGLALDHVEARVEQAGDHLVQRDRRQRLGGLHRVGEQPRGPVDRVASGQLARRLGAAHRERHRPAHRERAQRERAAGGLCRLIGRHPAVGLEHDDRRSVGEPLQAAAVRFDRPLQRLARPGRRPRGRARAAPRTGSAARRR